MAKRLTSVIIPCWNALAFTRVCVSRLLRLTEEPFELIAIDNGSQDGTAEWLERAGRAKRPSLSRLTIIRNEKNKGYAAAMNQGLEISRGDYVLFGNSDVAVTSGWLGGMLEAAAESKDTGMVVPCFNAPRPGRNGSPWAGPPWYASLKGLDRIASAGALLPGAAFAPARGFVPGFWAMIRRTVLELAGRFDESYGQGGYEDFDLQWRITRSGFRLGFARRVYVHHAWSASIRLNGLAPKPLFEPGRRLFLRRHPGAASLGIDLNESAPFVAATGKPGRAG